MSTGLALALPWLVLPLVALPLMLWRRPRLRDYAPAPRPDAPKVSIIIPARNEAVNLPGCLSGVLHSAHPDIEVIVVDDCSRDGTLEIAEAVAEAEDDRLRVVRGEPLPDGWFGKPWACWQGYRAATGDVLVFTDADTRHQPDLVGRALAALHDEGAAMVSVLPRQLMLGFWERLILPQVWFVLNARYPLASRVSRPGRPLDAMANGQFIMFRRDAYEELGGHDAVRDQVVEDVRLAQRLVETGKRLFVAHAEDLIETRMYRSLAGIIEGWTKNVAQGAMLSVEPRMRRIAPWFVALMPVALWIAPPVVLGAALAGVGGAVLEWWALGATAASLLFWAGANLSHRVPLAFTLAYPFGAAVTAFVFVRSAVRGGRISWKGRNYEG